MTADLLEGGKRHTAPAPSPRAAIKSMPKPRSRWMPLGRSAGMVNVPRIKGNHNDAIGHPSRQRRRSQLSAMVNPVTRWTATMPRWSVVGPAWPRPKNVRNVKPLWSNYGLAALPSVAWIWTNNLLWLFRSLAQ
jgi:electron-transferring-flavoprotein dehydrogenase